VASLELGIITSILLGSNVVDKHNRL